MPKGHRRREIQEGKANTPVFCVRCGKQRDVGDEHKCCGMCREYFHKNYLDNRVRIIKNSGMRNKRRGEEYLEYQRRWERSNKEKMSGYMKRFLEKYPDYKTNMSRTRRHKEQVYTKNEWLRIDKIVGGR